MVTNGMVHNEIDMKLLILYIMKRLPGPIDKESLFEICICDNGGEYFDFSEYLHELVENGHIAENDEEEFVITDKGIRNGTAVETGLPKSVRSAADRALVPAIAELERRKLIQTSQTEDESGVTVHLSVSDGEIGLLNMSVYCGDAERARLIRRNFRRNAEETYGMLLELLSR